MKPFSIFSNDWIDRLFSPSFIARIKNDSGVDKMNSPLWGRVNTLSGYGFSVGSNSLVNFDSNGPSPLGDSQHVSGGFFTCPPSRGGLYKFNVQLQINDSGVGFAAYINAFLVKNKITLPTSDSNDYFALFGWGSGDAHPSVQVEGLFRLVEGDTVACFGYQSAGSGRSTMLDQRTCFQFLQLTQD